MDTLQNQLLEYISRDDNKSYLQELLIDDPEYFMIFVNMEILGNEIGLDICADGHEDLIYSSCDFIKNNI
jgi:hypothetical protein